MRKILLILCVLLCTFPSFSQILKKEKIWTKEFTHESLTAFWQCDDNGNCIVQSLLLISRNSKYTHIIDLMQIYSGSPSEMYDFILKIEAFMNKYRDQEEISTTIGGLTVSIGKSSKRLSSVIVYTKEGYWHYTNKSLEEIKVALKNWALKNNINLAENEIIDDKIQISKEDKTQTSEARIIEDKIQISKADEIKKLKALLDEGALTQEEFDTEKKKILENSTIKKTKKIDIVKKTQFSTGVSASAGHSQIDRSQRYNYYNDKITISTGLFGRYTFAKLFFVNIGIDYNNIITEINKDILVAVTGLGLQHPTIQNILNASNNSNFQSIHVPIMFGIKYPMNLVTPLVSIGVEPSFNFDKPQFSNIKSFYLYGSANAGVSISINNFAIEPKFLYSINLSKKTSNKIDKYFLGGQVSLLYNF